jgi:hypothetical protein
MVLAEPGLIIAAAVEPLDQFEIASQRERRVDAGFVKGCKKDTEAQAVYGRSFAVCVWVFLVGIVLRFFDWNKAGLRAGVRVFLEKTSVR